MVPLTRLHWTQVIEMTPDVLNTIQQTSSAANGSFESPGLNYVLVVLLPQNP